MADLSNAQQDYITVRDGLAALERLEALANVLYETSTEADAAEWRRGAAALRAVRRAHHRGCLLAVGDPSASVSAHTVLLDPLWRPDDG